MVFYWVDDQGNVGFTDEGWSRVPSEFRTRTFLDEQGANNLSQAYNDYFQYMEKDRGIDELRYTDENTLPAGNLYGESLTGSNTNVSPMAQLLTNQRGGVPRDYAFYTPPERAQREVFQEPMSAEEFGSAPFTDLPTESNRFLESLETGDSTIGEGVVAEGKRFGGALQNNPMNQGIAQLPETQQNDTLTQLYQSGFRARR